MSKYIDAEKLIAEIERRKVILDKYKDSFETAACCKQELEWMEDFITSLKQEQPKRLCPHCVYYNKTDDVCEYPYGGIDCLINENGVYNCNGFEEVVQPEVDLEKEIDNVIADYSFTKTIDSGGFKTTVLDYAKIARHFYELGLNARKED